jgi:large subunit ribosomal protein L10
MITQQKKKEVVADLTEKFQNVKGFYVVDFTGMTVKNSMDLRRSLKAKNIGFWVAKNTLIQRAMKDAGLDFDIPQEVFAGQSAVVVGYDDPVAPAKLLKEFIDTTKLDRPKLKAAVVEGQYFPGSQLKQVSELPTREDMIAAILGSLQAPASGIVGTINAVMRDVASLVEEVAKSKAA